MLTAVTGSEIPLPNQNKWLEFKHFESVFGKRPTKKQNGDVSISLAGVWLSTKKIPNNQIRNNAMLVYI